MSVNHHRLQVTAFSIAIALLLQVAHSGAESGLQANNPLAITFSKWITGAATGVGVPVERGLMAGLVWGDVPDGAFVGEVIQRQVSANPALKTGITRLEAIYEVHNADGEHELTALIRGGTNNATGAAILDGVVLAGRRTGAPVHVEFQTVLGSAGVVGCTGAPVGQTCFAGTIYVGPAPRGGH